MKEFTLFYLLYVPENFRKFLEVFNKDYSQKREPNYNQLIMQYRNTQGYRKLFNDDKYTQLAYKCLEKEFGMNKQGAKLVPYSKLKLSIFHQKSRLSKLSVHKLEKFNLDKNTPNDVFSELWTLFNQLEVMASSSKLVGVSKTLHFLLPDLVMPIDREYVLPTIFGSKYVPSALDKQFEKFKEVFKAYSDLAQHLNLTVNNGDGNWWNVSVPKRIDNAIAGLLDGIKSGKLNFS